jgi:phosphoribosylformylglycinamidine synthase
LALAQAWIQSGQVLSASTASYGGPLEQIFKALVGNRFGFEFDEGLAKNPEALKNLLDWYYGSFIFEVREEQLETYAAEAEKEGLIFQILGKTLAEPVILCGDEKIALSKLQAKWEGVLEDVYPTQLSQGVEVGQIKDAWRPEAAQDKSGTEKDYTAISVLPKGLAKPKIVIPVFPGTNTEEETARAFREAGGDAEILIIKNLTLDALNQGLRETEKALKEAQILFIPGGFSGGDEPDGSGKFINAYFRNENLQAAIMELLRERDGLVGGICNGFQALVKLGLLPYGEIRLLDETAPTLDQNLIGRHQAMLVTTKVQTNRSPWLSQYEVGETHQVAISHGEGQFRGPEELIDRLFKNGQVATQYVDENGQASMDICYNPNSSMAAIEGLISEDGRVFGRMGHSERMVPGTLKNSGNPFQKSNVFAGAVRYFTEM